MDADWLKSFNNWVIWKTLTLTWKTLTWKTLETTYIKNWLIQLFL
jgi:hypothetical protein